MTRLAERPRPARVALFVTCLVMCFIPEVAKLLCGLLHRLGIAVDFPLARRVRTAGVQCGFSPASQKTWPGATSPCLPCRVHHCSLLARVRPCGGCFIRNCLRMTRCLGEQAEALAARTYELAEFLVHVLGVERLGAVFHGKVTYHASCHLLRELGVAEEHAG